METDLRIRLHLYATAAERLAGGGTPRRGGDSGCADAISCWRSATASHSAGIINSHARVLRGDSEPDPSRAGQDELDILIAGKPGKAANTESDQADKGPEKQRHYLPLPPGNNSAEILALGAEGVIILKGRNG
jgi:hypothetical protein